MKVKVTLEYEYDVDPNDYVTEEETFPPKGVELSDRVLAWDFDSEGSFAEFMWDELVTARGEVIDEEGLTLGIKVWTNRPEVKPDKEATP